MEVQVGDIVEVSVWNGGLVDKGEVREIFEFNGQREFMLLSQGVAPGEEVVFGERHVIRIISRG
jgi:hypothetical protein